MIDKAKNALYQITCIQVALIAVCYAIMAVRFVWFYYLLPQTGSDE